MYEENYEKGCQRDDRYRDGSVIDTVRQVKE